jgi:hypothetical protein
MKRAGVSATPHALALRTKRGRPRRSGARACSSSKAGVIRSRTRHPLPSSTGERREVVVRPAISSRHPTISVDRRPGKQTPCPQPFLTCPCRSTDSLAGPMRDRATGSAPAGTACTSGPGGCRRRPQGNLGPPSRRQRPGSRRVHGDRGGRRRPGDLRARWSVCRDCRPARRDDRGSSEAGVVDARVRAVVSSQPNVKTYARTPGSSNVISKVRWRMGPRWRTSWYIRGSERCLRRTRRRRRRGHHLAADRRAARRGGPGRPKSCATASTSPATRSGAG